ncbi:MAG TPA: hypothetical protein VEK07_05995 [Polyangiaceae bacterium]|nr:hypothetical protein [Polyangiaceae bacterium]
MSIHPTGTTSGPTPHAHPAVLAPGTGWAEEYLGGTQEAEERMIPGWASRIVAAQHRLAARNGRIMRALHAKAIAAPSATFRILSDVDPGQLAAAGFASGLPPELRSGVFTPGGFYSDVRVRFSNAAGLVGSDETKDLRGVAIRICMPERRVQDLLMTNAPASFARNPEQQVAVVEAAADRRTKLALFRRFGLFETLRILRATKLEVPRVDTLAAQQFYGRTPFRMGPYALKFKLEPKVAPTRMGPVKRTSRFLRDDLRIRLACDELGYHFRVQFFASKHETPIEDATVEWKTPFVTLGDLTLLKQDLDLPAGRALEAEVDALAFSPANQNGLVGIGSLNRARAAIYALDQHERRADTETRCPVGAAAVFSAP